MSNLVLHPNQSPSKFEKAKFECQEWETGPLFIADRRALFTFLKMKKITFIHKKPLGVQACLSLPMGCIGAVFHPIRSCQKTLMTCSAQ